MSSARRARRGSDAVLAGSPLRHTSAVGPWSTGATDHRQDQVIYYPYRADRAHRTLREIDEQIAKAEEAVAGTTPVKRNRFVQLTGGTRSVNRTLEAKARALAGLKGCVTNLDTRPDGTPITAGFVIDAYLSSPRFDGAS